MIQILKLFSKADPNAITIVSGLPRSGTSMMMQMLETGGIPALTDGFRETDIDNPKGYYEFEPVKQTKKDSSWLNDCEGKVVKMVSLLLYDLPVNRNYKVIFMQRKMDEILASQKKMLKRRGREAEIKQDEEMAAEYMQHLRKLYDWLEIQNHLDVVFISYNDMLNQPLKEAKKLKRFLKRDIHIKDMVHVVDKALYRQRA
jgi:hypothetical protein